jgi:uncharacterized protein (DUF924 family)
MSTPREILNFWFADGPDTRRIIWFQVNKDFDAACHALCGALLDKARDGAFDDWAETADGALALLLLLDQMPRNIHRGTALAFASDSKAREIARAAIARGHDKALTLAQRGFVYLPFEHSETLAEQDLSVRLFSALCAEPGYENPERTMDFVHRHHDVVRRFGRFPHRNGALGRISTVAEADYLARPGAGF